MQDLSPQEPHAIAKGSGNSQKRPDLICPPAPRVSPAVKATMHAETTLAGGPGQQHYGHRGRPLRRYAAVLVLALTVALASGYWALGFAVGSSSGDSGGAPAGARHAARRPQQPPRLTSWPVALPASSGAKDSTAGGLKTNNKEERHASSSSSSSSGASTTAAASTASSRTTTSPGAATARSSSSPTLARASAQPPPPVAILGAGGHTPLDEWETAPAIVGPQAACSTTVPALAPASSIRRERRPVFISHAGSRCPTAAQMDAGACVMRVGGSDPAVGCLPSLVVIGESRAAPVRRACRLL